jgi:hypothetical protein
MKKIIIAILIGCSIFSVAAVSAPKEAEACQQVCQTVCTTTVNGQPPLCQLVCVCR